jgi:hypothetical protein
LSAAGLDFTRRYLWWPKTGFAVAVLAGLVFWMWPSLHRKCLYEYCVGDKADFADASTTIDIRDRRPFAFLPRFRAGDPPDIYDSAKLVLWKDGSGKIAHIRLIVFFGESSIVDWGDKLPTIRRWMSANLYMRAKTQIVQQRRGIWQELDHLHGTRTLMQIWPGTGGFAAVKIDTGYFDDVPPLDRNG